MATMLHINQVRFTGGGTGSSMALTLSYMRQHQLRREAGIREYRMTTDMLLPGNHTNFDDQLRQSADTWAELVEYMVHFASPQPPLEYGPLKIDRSRPPCSVLTLYDVKNANGELLTNEQVRHVAAEVWFQKSFGPVADYYFSHLLVDVASQLRYPYVASAAGACRYTVPVSELITAFSLATAQRLVGREYLLRESPEAEAWGQQGCQAFISQQGLRDLSRFFQQDKSGKQLGYNLKPFEKVRLGDVMPQLSQYTGRTVAEWERALQRRVHEVGGQVCAALDQHMTRLVNEDGPLAAGCFLSSPDPKEGQGLIGRLQRDRKRLHQQLTRLSGQAELHHRLGLKRRGWKKLNLTFQFPRRQVLKHQETTLKLKLDQVRVAAVLALLDLLLARATWWQDELLAWQSTLERVGDIAAQQAEELARYRASQQEQALVVQNILDAEDEQRLFEQRLADVLRLASKDLSWVWAGDQLVLGYRETGPAGRNKQGQEQRLNRWDLRSDEGIAQLVEYCATFWLPLKDELSVEAIVEKEGWSVDELVARMMDLAAPLIAMDDIKQAKPIRKEVIIGSEKGASGVLRGLASKPGLTVIETGDRWNLQVLITWWGLNPLAVSQFESWRRAYDYLQAQGEQLHVLVFDKPKAWPDGAQDGETADSAASPSPVPEKER